MALFEIDDVARKAKKHGGATWTDELRARAEKLGGEEAVARALSAIEFVLAERRKDHHDPARRWPSLRHPHTLDYQHLVQLRRPDEKFPELFVGPDEERRQRRSFKLTDKRGSAREVEQEIDYCLYCHERDKDSCSKGLHEKDDSLKKNPLGVELRGCPLGEKISEMHVMRREGDPLAALALVTIDNPMCAGTGHRICNDCMKACVFQKQEPVNIPQIETRVLTEVLAMPWGLEIYMLLMRFNPLNVERPHALPYNGRNVLVVGLGPAGYTLAHHLACEGYGVVAIDGLKLEPLPLALTGNETQPPEPVRDSMSIYNKLDERILLGFGGVSEYGITVRWDKNFLTLVYLSLARNRNVRMYGGVRFGGTLLLEDAWDHGIDHVAIAAGAGRPTLIDIKNNLARGIRKASDFLMALQLTGAYKHTSIANLQISLPAVVIGGGLTAIDTATELLAYYLVQIEKTVDRFDVLEKSLTKDQLAKLFDAEELEQMQEHVAHGRALRAEKEAAKREGREPNVQKLLDGWGGVTLVYRKSLQESPAYRLNHEEVMKSLEEGVRYVENLSPTEAVVDERKRVSAMRFGRADGTIVELPAKTVCVAAGTSPNVTYEREHPGTFELDKRGHYFKGYEAFLDEAGKVVLRPAEVSSSGFFTSYKNGADNTVSFYGDNHPYYAGSVVKAMASAKDGYARVAALLKPTSDSQSVRYEKRRALFARLDDELIATVHEVNRLTSTIIEVVVRAPLAARKFHPGQFYRLQNYETRAPLVAGTRLAMEGLALTGAWVDQRARPHGHDRPRDGIELAPLRDPRAGRARRLDGPDGRADGNREPRDRAPLRRRSRKRSALLDRARVPRDGQQGRLLRRLQRRARRLQARRDRALHRSSRVVDGRRRTHRAESPARRALSRQHRPSDGRLRRREASKTDREALRREPHHRHRQRPHDGRRARGAPRRAPSVPRSASHRDRQHQLADAVHDERSLRAVSAEARRSEDGQGDDRLHLLQSGSAARRRRLRPPPPAPASQLDAREALERVAGPRAQRKSQTPSRLETPEEINRERGSLGQHKISPNLPRSLFNSYLGMTPFVAQPRTMSILPDCCWTSVHVVPHKMIFFGFFGSS